MNTQVLDGRVIAQKILTALQVKCSQLKTKPKLLILQIGDNAASTQYVSLKKKRGEEIGISIIVQQVNTEEQIREAINTHRDKVSGIMIQLPLPTGFNTQEILSLIPQELDVDGLLLENSPFNTAVADAVVTILATVQSISNTTELLIIGDTPYVGGSIANALTKQGFVNIKTIHEFSTQNEDAMKSAEIVISCVGRPHIFSAKQLKEGSVLIDVGTSPNQRGEIVGDFDTSEAVGHLRAYTPVPGGVGPVTVAQLLKHVVQISEKAN